MDRQKVQGQTSHFLFPDDNLTRADVVLFWLLCRVMVAGPMDSGKSSLATILSAYAARSVEKFVMIVIHLRPVLAITS